MFNGPQNNVYGQIDMEDALWVTEHDRRKNIYHVVWYSMSSNKCSVSDATYSTESRRWSRQRGKFHYRPRKCCMNSRACSMSQITCSTDQRSLSMLKRHAPRSINYLLWLLQYLLPEAINTCRAQFDTLTNTQNKRDPCSPKHTTLPPSSRTCTVQRNTI